MKVLKYWLVSGGNKELRLQLPEGAKILSVANQDDKIVLYAMADETKPKQERVVVLVNTGEALDKPDELCYIGSVQTKNESAKRGVYVTHVYVRERPWTW